MAHRRRHPEALRALGVLRARQWLHFAPLPLVGLELRAGALPRGALGVAAACLALGYAYGVNALADRGSDVSVTKNPLAGERVVPPGASLVVAAAALGAIFLSFGLGGRAPWLVLASLAAGTVYSVGPRLKALPVLGTLVNLAIFAPLLGFASGPGSAPPGAAVISVTFVGALLQSQLLHEAADSAEDAAGGVLTTARWLGPAKTRVVVAAVAAPFAALAAALAPSSLSAWIAVLVLASGAVAAPLERDWASARRLHRYLAMAGGGLLFLLGHLA